MKRTTQEKVSKAATEIATILETLEKETGEIVERIDLSDIDVTGVGDPGKTVMRSVQIDLRRLPGVRWAK